MYKCSECGTEFETAPKYCDCGNDIFINVEYENEYIPQEIDDDIEPVVKTSKYHGGGRNFRQKTFSPFSLGIFVFCIIMSILVLFVIANPKKSPENQSKIETAEEIVIPPIESYWDDTPAKVVQKEEPQPQKQENILDKIVQQIVPQEPPQKEVKNVVQTVKTTPTPAQKKTVQPVVKNQTKTTQKQTTQQSNPKNAPKSTSGQSGMTFEDLTNKIRNQYPAQSQTQTQKQSTQITTQAPLPQTNLNKTKTTSTQTTAHTTQTPQTAKSQVQTQTLTQTASAPVVSQKSQTQLKQELVSYKSGLRNAIGRKIDFTRVIGDGDCTLSFKVNSNGRLTSKAFTKQSSNITLNDAVFNALNTMTSYNPPPEGYNGETLRLYIKFYDGNFEISLN